MTPTSDPKRRDEPPTDDYLEYAQLELATGEIVIYDRTNPEAWIQTDEAVIIAANA
ncbi:MULTISPECIES: hypothetical protein [unclassified Haladaptatus]|uniref:DUF7331 family protein n=1 Tax=unclassified Haladaptatus TaxID=2622732 RepID=UPI0023E7C567|nr:MULTISPECIES: hypothetical protein [unclassified Haladaptatus]